MLAQALALRARGHEVTLAAPPNFRDWLKGYGFEAPPFGHDFQSMVDELAHTLGDRPLLMLRTVLGLLRETLELQYREAQELVPGHDLAFGGGAQLAANLVCEGLGVPFGFIAYAPQLLPSKHHAPLFMPVQLPLPASLAPHANRLLWALNEQLWDRVLLRAGNRIRAGYGLPPLGSFWDQMRNPRTRLILATDPALSPLPPDLGHVFQPGFLQMPPQDASLPPELETLLGDDRPTLYLGFGSMGDPDPATTTRLINEAARLAGARVLLSSGWAGLGAIGAENVHRIGSVPHQALFPRLAGVIHHGGAGTTAAAATAGVPQMAVPHLMDQYYWGHRIAAETLGPPPLARGQLSARALAKTMRLLIETAAYRQSAARMGEALRARDGTAAFCAYLEAGMPDQPG